MRLLRLFFLTALCWSTITTVRPVIYTGNTFDGNGWTDLTKNTRRFRLNFTGKSKNDMHVGFKLMNGYYYELVLGGWRNGHTVTRYYKETGGKVSVTIQIYDETGTKVSSSNTPRNSSHYNNIRIPDTSSLVNYFIDVNRGSFTWGYLSGGAEKVLFTAKHDGYANGLYRSYSFRTFRSQPFQVDKAWVTYPTAAEGRALIAEFEKEAAAKEKAIAILTDVTAPAGNYTFTKSAVLSLLEKLDDFTLPAAEKDAVGTRATEIQDLYNNRIVLLNARKRFRDFHFEITNKYNSTRTMSLTDNFDDYRIPQSRADEEAKRYRDAGGSAAQEKVTLDSYKRLNDLFDKKLKQLQGEVLTQVQASAARVGSMSVKMSQNKATLAEIDDTLAYIKSPAFEKERVRLLALLTKVDLEDRITLFTNTSSFEYNAQRYKAALASTATQQLNQFRAAADKVISTIATTPESAAVNNVTLASIGAPITVAQVKEAYTKAGLAHTPITKIENDIKVARQQQKERILAADMQLGKVEQKAIAFNFDTIKYWPLKQLTALTDQSLKQSIGYAAAEQSFNLINRPLARLDEVVTSVTEKRNKLIELRLKIQPLQQAYLDDMKQRREQIKNATNHTELPPLEWRTKHAALQTALDNLARFIKDIPKIRTANAQITNKMINEWVAHVNRWKQDADRQFTAFEKRVTDMKAQVTASTSSAGLPAPLSDEEISTLTTLFSRIGDARSMKAKNDPIIAQINTLAKEVNDAIAQKRATFVAAAQRARDDIIDQARRLTITIRRSAAKTFAVLVIPPANVERAIAAQKVAYDDDDALLQAETKKITDAVGLLSLEKSKRTSVLAEQAANAEAEIEALEKRGDDEVARVASAQQAALDTYTSEAINQILDTNRVRRLIRAAQLAETIADEYDERITEAHDELRLAVSAQVARIEQARQAVQDELFALIERSVAYEESISTLSLDQLSHITNQTIADKLATSQVTQVTDYSLLSDEEKQKVRTDIEEIIAGANTAISGQKERVEQLHSAAKDGIAQLQARAATFIEKQIKGHSRTTLDQVSRERAAEELNIDELQQTLKESYLPATTLSEYTDTINKIITDVMAAHQAEYVVLESGSHSALIKLKAAFASAKEAIQRITFDTSATSPEAPLKAFSREPFNNALTDAQDRFKKDNKDLSPLTALDTELTKIYAHKQKALRAQQAHYELTQASDEVIAAGKTKTTSDGLAALFPLSEAAAASVMSLEFKHFTQDATALRTILIGDGPDVSDVVTVAVIEKETARVRRELRNMHAVLSADEALRAAIADAMKKLANFTTQTDRRIAAITSMNTHADLDAAHTAAKERAAEREKLRAEVDAIKNPTGAAAVDSSSITTDHERLMRALQDRYKVVTGTALEKLYTQRDAFIAAVEKTTELSALRALQQGTESAQQYRALKEQAATVTTLFAATKEIVPAEEKASYTNEKVTAVTALIESTLKNQEALLRRESAGFLLIDLRSFEQSTIRAINAIDTQTALRAFNDDEKQGVRSFTQRVTLTKNDLIAAIAALKAAQKTPSPEQLTSLDPVQAEASLQRVQAAYNKRLATLKTRDVALDSFTQFKAQVETFITVTLPTLDDTALQAAPTRFDGATQKEQLAAAGLSSYHQEVDGLLKRVETTTYAQRQQIARTVFAAFKEEILNFIKEVIPGLSQKEVEATEEKPLGTDSLIARLQSLELSAEAQEVPELVKLRERALRHQYRMANEKHKEQVTAIAPPPVASLESELQANTPPALRAKGITFRWRTTDWVAPQKSFKVRFYANATDGFALGIGFIDANDTFGYYRLRIGDKDGQGRRQNALKRHGAQPAAITSIGSVTVPPPTRPDGYTFYQFSIVGNVLHLLAYDPNDEKLPYKTIIHATDPALSRMVKSFVVPNKATIDFHKIATQGQFFDVRLLSIAPASKETRRNDGIFSLAHREFVIPDDYTDEKDPVPPATPPVTTTETTQPAPQPAPETPAPIEPTEPTEPTPPTTPTPEPTEPVETEQPVPTPETGTPAPTPPVTTTETTQPVPTPETETPVPSVPPTETTQPAPQPTTETPAPVVPVEPKEPTTPTPEPTEPVETTSAWAYLPRTTVKGRPGKQLLVQPRGDRPAVIALRNGSDTQLTFTLDAQGLHRQTGDAAEKHLVSEAISLTIPDAENPVTQTLVMNIQEREYKSSITPGTVAPAIRISFESFENGHSQGTVDTGITPDTKPLTEYQLTDSTVTSKHPENATAKAPSVETGATLSSGVTAAPARAPIMGAKMRYRRGSSLR